MTAHVTRLFVACAVFVSVNACAKDLVQREPAQPAISFHTIETEREFGAVDVAPISIDVLNAVARLAPTVAQWQQILAVRAGDSAALPMLGSYQITNDTLRFFPRFAPTRGTVYYARFSIAGLRALTDKAPAVADARGRWRMNARTGASTAAVVSVYPSSDVVPMNLLRMYIYFSEPMMLGEAEQRIKLIDDAEREVKDAFLVAAGGQELWDPEHKRLTVFFDPGRIKRDLTPHEKLGLPLQEGKSYRLVIDGAWHDALGLPLPRGFEKRFRVGAIDRGVLKTSAWTVGSPIAGDGAPLVIDFHKSLDHGMLQRMIGVMRANGSPVPGKITIAKFETHWSFWPSEAWSKGEYYVNIDTELEDVAGNSLRRPFDIMPGDSATRGVSSAAVRVPFIVK